jgi:hypothetical protein
MTALLWYAMPAIGAGTLEDYVKHAGIEPEPNDNQEPNET